MKHFGAFFGIIAIGITAFVLYSFQAQTSFGWLPEYRPYVVSNTKDQWQQVINNIEQAKGIMLRSTYPGNEIAASMDSLSMFEQKIQIEVSQQIAVFEKKDSSTNAVKPKK